MENQLIPNDNQIKEDSTFVFSYYVNFYIVFFFDKPYIQIDTNHLSEKSFYFTDLDDNYKRSSDFNRIWSKLHSKRYRPYHRFLEKNIQLLARYKTFRERIFGNKRSKRKKI